MALNYSHRRIFPAHRTDENIVQGGNSDADIRELLPADPFGMDISSTVTAITGWLEDLGASDCGGDIGKGDFKYDYGYGYGYDYQLFAGWDFWLNTASMKFGAWNKKVNDGGIRFACTFEGSKCSTTTTSSCRFDEYVGGCVDGYLLQHDKEKELGDLGVDLRGCVDGYLCDEKKRELRDSVYNVGVDFGGCVDGCYSHNEEVKELRDSGYNVDVDLGGCSGRRFDKVDDCVKNVVDINDEDDGAPHPALSFALGYLGVRDLLSVERVCKSLRVAVQTDTLLWRSIHIDQPLNDRITDDVLLELTNRAQGHLQCLSLVKCQWITDDGLKRVLDSNKELTKLSVPGCTRLSIDGVVNCLRSFKPEAITGLKYLRVGGLFGVTLKHFEELVSLLGIHDQVPANHHKPRFYHRGNIYLSFEDDRPIDIEMCPWCQNLRLVYDCPVEGCRGKDQATQLCRACTLCISRCVQCGKCINDGEYVETFCLEFICLDCWKQVLQCQERQDVEGSHSRHAVPQEPVISYHGLG